MWSVLWPFLCLRSSGRCRLWPCLCLWSSGLSRMCWQQSPPVCCCAGRWFILICLVSVGSDVADAIQIKLGGAHLQSWDARLESLPASSLPFRVQPWGAGSAGASPAPVPPNKPAQSYFLLTDLLQNNGPCKAQPLQESRVAPGIRKLPILSKTINVVFLQHVD